MSLTRQEYLEILEGLNEDYHFNERIRNILLNYGLIEGSAEDE